MEDAHSECIFLIYFCIDSIFLGILKDVEQLSVIEVLIGTAYYYYAHSECILWIFSGIYFILLPLEDVVKAAGNVEKIKSAEVKAVLGVELE